MVSNSKWSNFDLLSYSDGRCRLNVGISSPSDNVANSKTMFHISLSNDAIRQSLTLGYHECVELDTIFSKLRDKEFLKKLFTLVETRGTQDVIRNIKKRVIRISFLVSNNNNLSKIEMYTNPNDVLEIVVPLSIILSIADLLHRFLEDFIDVNLQVHTIRRLDEIITMVNKQNQALERIKININNLTNSKPSDGYGEAIEPEILQSNSSEEVGSDLLADFQLFEEQTDVSIDVPSDILLNEGSKKK